MTVPLNESGTVAAAVRCLECGAPIFLEHDEPEDDDFVPVTKGLGAAAREAVPRPPGGNGRHAKPGVAPLQTAVSATGGVETLTRDGVSLSRQIEPTDEELDQILDPVFGSGAGNQPVAAPVSPMAALESQDAPGASAGAASVSSPVWGGLYGHLLYPLAGWGPIYCAVFAIVAWMAPLSGAIGGILLAVCLLAYATLVLRSSASGDEELPNWLRLRSWEDLGPRVLAMLAVSLMAALPAGAALLAAAALPKLLGAAAFIAAALAGLVYLPMAALGTCLARAAVGSCDPRLAMASIRVHRSSYAGFLLFALALVCAGGGLVLPLGHVPVPGGAILALTATYALFVLLHALGALACDRSLRAQWDAGRGARGGSSA